MIRICALVLFAALAPSYATTVIKAPLDDLIAKSTSIVRGRVAGSYTSTQGRLVNTYYKIQVEELWKGPAATQVDVQVPGGLKQNIAGVPQLANGAEYVFFLWKGPSGTTHLLGLSQGVLDITKDSSGNMMVIRQASDALVVDSATGRATQQDPLRMKLSDLSSRVAGARKAQ